MKRRLSPWLASLGDRAPEVLSTLMTMLAKGVIKPHSGMRAHVAALSQPYLMRASAGPERKLIGRSSAAATAHQAWWYIRHLRFLKLQVVTFNALENSSKPIHLLRNPNPSSPAWRVTLPLGRLLMRPSGPREGAEHSANWSHVCHAQALLVCVQASTLFMSWLMRP